MIDAQKFGEKLARVLKLWRAFTLGRADDSTLYELRTLARELAQLAGDAIDNEERRAQS